MQPLPSLKPTRPKKASSSFFWLSLCVFLFILVSVTAWKAWHYKPQINKITQAGGSTIQVGVPEDANRQDKMFDAASAVLIDTRDDRIMFQQNAFERRPIASISKLMTAMVALEYGIPWDQPADIEPEEYVQGGNLQLFRGEKVTMRDLFNASLLGSANNATLAYVRQLGIPKEQFIQAMNRKAIELGLEQTEFHDVTGLNPDNVSTAYEVARMATIAFTKYPAIAAATSQKEYSFQVVGTGREHTIHNTNKLVSTDGETEAGSKTGYLYEAQYCLVMQGKGEQNNRIAVILGSPSEQGQFIDMQHLIQLNVP